MELRCRPLDVAALESELECLCDVVTKAGTADVEAMYGWACRVPDADRDRPLRIRAESLRAFVHDSRARGAFVLGASDLHLASSDGAMEFVLCHEADVHVLGADGVVEPIRRRWEAQGFDPYVVKGSGPDGARSAP